MKIKTYSIQLLTGLIFLGIYLSCSSQNTDENTYLDEQFGQLDSMTFDEIKDNIKSFSSFNKFFLNFNDELKPSDYDANKEENKEPIKLSEDIGFNPLQKINPFSQVAKYPKSELVDYNFYSVGNGQQISIIINQIYYNDGTIEFPEKEISNKITAKLKKIDSVRITIKDVKATKINEIRLSKQHKEVNYKNGKITLTDLDKNFVEFQLPVFLKYFFLEVQAYTKSENIVNSNASMSVNSAKEIKKIIEISNELADNIESNDYASKEELIKAMRKKFAFMTTHQKSDSSELSYHSATFDGNVKELIIYMVDNFETKEYQYTVPVNSELGKYFLVTDNKNNMSSVVDFKGNTIGVKHKNLNQINDYYYSIVDYYNNIVLHLNEQTKTLDTIQPYKPRNIRFLTKNNVEVNYRGRHGVLDANNKLVIPLENVSIETFNDVTIAYSSHRINRTDLYDSNFNLISSLPGEISQFNDQGWACYSINNKPQYLINSKGIKGAAMSKYDAVEVFKNELAKVRIGYKYGYIRFDGTEVVPVIYDEIENFEMGISRVIVDNKVGLINTNNEFVLPLQNHTNASIKGSNDKRVYEIDDQKYNYKGLLIPD